MFVQINTVLGDYSAVAHGFVPDQLGEVGRIQIHLRFVCRYLQLANTEHLTMQQQRNRRNIIRVLQSYAEAGIFPLRIDDKFAGRRPRFVDHRGVHCAVGHLMAQTEGYDLPVRINEKHEYDFVPDIEMDEVVQWANEQGLSVLECAMIQPMYLPPIGDWDCPYLALSTDNDLAKRADAVRHFRDQHLQTNAVGRKLVQTYYKVGPGMVRFMDRYPWTQEPVRQTLLLVTRKLQ